MLKLFFLAVRGSVAGWSIGSMLQFAAVEKGVIKKAFDAGSGLQFLLSPLQILGAMIGAISVILLFHSLRKNHHRGDAYDIALGYWWGVGAFGLLGGSLGARMHSTIVTYAGVIVGCLLGYQLTTMYFGKHDKTTAAQQNIAPDATRR